MSRNSSGTYSLPNPPFVPNTTINSATVNGDFNDVADALTDSLSRTGLGGMQSQLPLATAGFAYSADPDTGMSRSAANTQVITVGGLDYTFTTTDVTTPAGASLLPLVGEIRMWALPTEPTGWVFMRGGAATVTYPLWRAALIAAGSPYGTSGSDPLFPNMQCRLVAGFDVGGVGLLTGSTVLGNTIGQQNRTLLTANLPAYTPTGTVGITDPGHLHGNGAAVDKTARDGGGTPALWTGGAGNTSSNTTGITASFTGDAQGGTSTPVTTIQPTIILNFIGRAA